MRLTPFAKLFITVVIVGVLGYAFWHYKGSEVRQWAVGDKPAAAEGEKVAASDFDALKNAPADPGRDQGSVGVTPASLASGGKLIKLSSHLMERAAEQVEGRLDGEASGWSSLLKKLDRIDPGVARLALIVLHGQLESLLDRHILGEFAARHVHEGLLVEFAVGVRGRNDDILALADLHSDHFAFQPGDDIAVPHQKLQRILSFGRIDLLLVHVQCIFHGNDHIFLYGICTHFESFQLINWKLGRWQARRFYLYSV